MLALDMAEAFDTIDAHGFALPILEHAKGLKVFLVIFFEDQLSLLVVHFILHWKDFQNNLSLEAIFVLIDGH